MLIERHVARDVPTCSSQVTAGEVRDGLAANRYESAADVAVCDDAPGRPTLLGLVSMERLLAAEAGVPMAELMDPDLPVVTQGLDQEKAAWKAVRHGHASLVVVDESGDFVGLVPPVRLLAVMLAEHDEDLARLGGFLKSSASARHALEESSLRRLWHRLPWLLVGLVGAALAAWVVERFEASVTADVRLAYFIPGIVYLASAVGTQTQTLVIRGLSVGVPLRRVFLSETLTGITIGLALAAVTALATAWVFSSGQLALALGLSLMAACAAATVVAIALPWILGRLGRDPAFGSGPLATVIQDLMTLVIYFGVAVAIL